MSEAALSRVEAAALGHTLAFARSAKLFLAGAGLCLLGTTVVQGQYRMPKTAREVPSDSISTPDWKVAAPFKRDVFTFVRIAYHGLGRRYRESEYYFREFSEKKAYPLGINIVFYAMTH